MATHKFKEGDLVVLISRSEPSSNGHYFIRARVLPSDNDAILRTGEHVSEPLYLLEGLGDKLWLERTLSLVMEFQ